ncbi:MAG: histidine phosphatase family protein [Deltaproteobacteria bacterium]|nr:histidine phosphatase family protein [Deltaproteobacteria bacterium]
MSFSDKVNRALAQVPGYFTESQAETLRGVQSQADLDARLEEDPELRHVFEVARQNAAFQQAWEAHEELRGITGDTAAEAAAGLAAAGARFKTPEFSGDDDEEEELAREIVRFTASDAVAWLDLLIASPPLELLSYDPPLRELSRLLWKAKELGTRTDDLIQTAAEISQILRGLQERIGSPGDGFEVVGSPEEGVRYSPQELVYTASLALALFLEDPHVKAREWGISLHLPKPGFPLLLTNTFYGVRHGMSIPKARGIIMSDPRSSVLLENGLTMEGARQAGAEMQGWLAAHPEIIEKAKRGEVVIVSSDFSRARETAEILAYLLGIDSTEILIHAGLRERAFGELEGMPVSHYEKVFDADAVDPTHTAGGVESVAAVASRMAGALRKIDAEVGQGTLVFVVGHGSTLHIGRTVVQGKDLPAHHREDSWRVAEIRPLNVKERVPAAGSGGGQGWKPGPMEHKPTRASSLAGMPVMMRREDMPRILPARRALQRPDVRQIKILPYTPPRRKISSPVGALTAEQRQKVRDFERAHPIPATLPPGEQVVLREARAGFMAHFAGSIGQARGTSQYYTFKNYLEEGIWPRNPDDRKNFAHRVARVIAGPGREPEGLAFLRHYLGRHFLREFPAPGNPGEFSQITAGGIGEWFDAVAEINGGSQPERVLIRWQTGRGENLSAVTPEPVGPPLPYDFGWLVIARREGVFEVTQGRGVKVRDVLAALRKSKPVKKGELIIRGNGWLGVESLRAEKLAEMTLADLESWFEVAKADRFLLRWSTLYDHDILGKLTVLPVDAPARKEHQGELEIVRLEDGSYFLEAHGRAEARVTDALKNSPLPLRLDRNDPALDLQTLLTRPLREELARFEKEHPLPASLSKGEQEVLKSARAGFFAFAEGLFYRVKGTDHVTLNRYLQTGQWPVAYRRKSFFTAIAGLTPGGMEFLQDKLGETFLNPPPPAPVIRKPRPPRAPRPPRPIRYEASRANLRFQPKRVYLKDESGQGRAYVIEWRPFEEAFQILNEQHYPENPLEPYQFYTARPIHTFLVRALLGGEVVGLTLAAEESDASVRVLLHSKKNQKINGMHAATMAHIFHRRKPSNTIVPGTHASLGSGNGNGGLTAGSEGTPSAGSPKAPIKPIHRRRRPFGLAGTSFREPALHSRNVSQLVRGRVR